MKIGAGILYIIINYYVIYYNMQVNTVAEL